MQNEQNTNGKIISGSKNDIVTPDVDTHQNNKIVKTKIKRENKCDLGPNFVAPDGGWGWLIVIAAGTSNVSFDCRRDNEPQV